VRAGAAALAFAGVVAGAAAAAPPRAPAGAQERFEQRYELARLAGFPSERIALTPRARDVFYRLGSYNLPVGARQGPNLWYVGHLHFRVTVERLEGSGRIYVSADTGDRTWAQIELERTRAGGQPAIRWSTYDLFSGASAHVVRGNSVEVSFSNYLQERGVQPGVNPIRLHIEQFGRARAATVVVHPDSAIERTRRSPLPLAIRIEPLDEPPTEGDTFRVRVTLATKATGDTLRRVSVKPRFDPRELELVAPTPRTSFATLRGRQTATFSFRALRAGRHQIGFLAASNINNPAAALFVDVNARAGGALGGTGRWVGVALLVAGAALAGIAARRRHQPRASQA
jgi:hypothetical protein